MIETDITSIKSAVERTLKLVNDIERHKPKQYYVRSGRITKRRGSELIYMKNLNMTRTYVLEKMVSELGVKIGAARDMYAACLKKHHELVTEAKSAAFDELQGEENGN